MIKTFNQSGLQEENLQLLLDDDIEKKLVELQDNKSLFNVVRVFAVDKPFFPPSRLRYCPLYDRECFLGFDCESGGLLKNLNTLGRYGQPEWSQYYYVEKHSDNEYLRWWGCDNCVGFEFKEACVR